MNLKSHVRTAAKVVSWRVIGAVDTFVLAYLMTGKATAAVGLVGLEIATKSVWYYGHERVWELPFIAKFFTTS